jgi:hypothetical protein
MKPYTKKNAVIVLVSASTLLWCACEYPAWRFRGDGRFSGGPLFGYSVTMPTVPFDRAGEYVFRFRGLPNEDMSLQLYADGKTDRDRDELTHLGTTLDALLVDHNGRAVCQATGVPRDGQNEHIWVVMSSHLEVAFWHWNCVHIPLNSSESYTLTLHISNVDPKTPSIGLVPVLSGGQLDFP